MASIFPVLAEHWSSGFAFSLEVNEESRSGLLEILGSGRFEEPLFRQALTHRSVGDFNNQRLEFLGDALLGLLVAEILYEKFPKATEGEMSLHRSGLVKSSTLAAVAREHGIDRSLVLGKSLAGRRPIVPDSALEDAMEALVAAFYITMGFEKTQEFVRQLFSSRLQTLSSGTAVKPNKSRLQEFLQARGQALPTYIVLEDSGSGEDHSFCVECVVMSREIRYSAEAKGRKKSMAEEISAGLVLELLSKKERRGT